MEALIKIEERKGGQAVSARELHFFLESRKDFSSWIKDRISKYGLIENVDFEVFTNLGENPQGGRPLTEYALSVDSAKELSMVEGNEKGKQARLYFIETEKELKRQALRFAVPQTFSEALHLAANQADTIEKQKAIITEQAPKVLFSNAVEASEQSCLIRNLAIVLNQNGFSIGQNRLFGTLRDDGFLCKAGESYNQPTQRAMDMGLFEVKKTTIPRGNSTPLVTTTTKVTGKGQIYFVNHYLKSIKEKSA